MSKREEAQEFLQKLYLCTPKFFNREIEAMQRGFGFVLSYLEQANGEVNAGDLAKKLDVSTARIAVLLKRMEKSGLITRHASPEDARRTVVAITPAGVALVDGMREQTLKRIEQLLAQVSKEDLETYIRISHQIKKAMNE